MTYADFFWALVVALLILPWIIVRAARRYHSPGGRWRR